MNPQQNPDPNLDPQDVQQLVELDESVASGELPAGFDSEASTLDLGPGVSLPDLHDCLHLLERVRKHSPDSLADLVYGPSAGQMWLDVDSDQPVQIGRFVIRRRLGQGGFGLVFLAFDPDLDREVALKVPRIETLIAEQTRERFLREGRAAAQLNHANIAAVYDVGSVGPICYIASAYCAGDSLAGYLRRAAIRAGEAVKRRVENPSYTTAATLVMTLAEAVQHAHSRGILHRDLKPSNILFADAEEETSHPFPDPLSSHAARIVDFGLAKRLESVDGQTQTGATLGTPAYMSPEQAAGDTRRIGPATDIYALGAILYELITGSAPFKKNSDVDTIVAVRNEEPVPPRRIQRDCPRDLQAICLRCLEKEPEQRYVTATALADDLNRFLAGEPVAAQPIGNLKRLTRWAARNRVLAAVSAAAALLLVGVAVATTVGYVQVSRALAIADQALAGEQHQRQRAQDEAAEAARQRDRAEANRRAARRAVDEYFTTISENTLLEKPTLIPLRQELLQHAQDYYQQLVDQPGNTPEMRAELAISYLRVGIIAQDLGDPNWLEPVRKTLDILEQLLADDVSLVDLPVLQGGVYHVRSSRLDIPQTAEALQVIQRAIEIWEGLARERPNAAGFQSDLGALYLVEGLLHRLRRNRSDALASFERSREIREPLVEAYPNEPKYRYFLAESCGCLAMQLNAAGRPGEALPISRKAAQLFEESLHHYPDSPRIEFNLSFVHAHSAMALAALNKPLPAMLEAQKALKIQERLASDYPTFADYQVGLAVGYVMLVDRLSRAGFQGPATEVKEKARRQIQLVLETRLDTGHFTTMLDQGYYQLAEFMRRDGRHDEAELLYHKVLEIQSQYPQSDAHLVDSSLRQLVRFALRDEDWERTEEKLRALVAIRRRLGGSPDERLAHTLYHWGRTLRLLSQFDEAEMAMRETLAIRRRILGETHGDVAAVLFRLGQISHGKGNLDVAEQLYREALAVGSAALGEHDALVIRVRKTLEQLVQDRANTPAEPDEAKAF